MNDYAPLLPKHYRISPVVAAEISALCDDLDLVLRGKSRFPFPAQECRLIIEYNHERYLQKKLEEEIYNKKQASRQMCESLCVRNHKRKNNKENVFKSFDNYTQISLWD